MENHNPQGAEGEQTREELIAELRDLRARLAAAQTAERYIELFENANDIIYTQDLAGRFTAVNQAMEQLVGYTRDEILGLHATQLVAPQYLEMMQRLIGKRASGDGDQQYEIEIVAKDGRRIPLEVSTRMIYQRGEPVGVQGIARDVTKRRRAEDAMRESEQQLRAVFESAPVGIVRLDLEGQSVNSNPAVREMLGYTEQNLRELSLEQIIHADDVASARQQLLDLLAGRSERYQAERRYLRSDGQILWGSTTAFTVHDSAHKPQFYIVMMENVTERKHAERALQESHEKLTGWVIELEQRTLEISLLSEMGELLQACRSADEAYNVTARMAQHLFPLEAGAICILTPTDRVETAASWGDPPLRDRVFERDECWALRRSRLHLVEDAQLGMVCKHVQRPLTTSYLCVPLTMQGESLGILHLCQHGARKFSEARKRLAITVAEQIALALSNIRLQEKLVSQSIRDPLTGLFNRRYMEESLTREMSRAARQHHSVGIIMLDIDHFKQFNDAYGHDMGDQLLRELGRILQGAIRGEDIACRYGGEEFTLIMPEVSLSDAAQRAEQIREEVRRLQLATRRQQISPVSASLGVAIYPDHGPTGDAVLRAADLALYRAKAEGRDRVVTQGFSPVSTTIERERR